eukprot:2692006-Amphidinium_carterae.1
MAKNAQFCRRLEINLASPSAVRSAMSACAHTISESLALFSNAPGKPTNCSSLGRQTNCPCPNCAEKLPPSCTSHLAARTTIGWGSDLARCQEL